MPMPTKRKWTDDDIPLAVLKKIKGQQLFPGLMSNMELAAFSLASLKEGDSSLGTFLTINPLHAGTQHSPHPSPIQESLPHHERLSTTAAPSVSALGPTLVSPRPLRRFSRAPRGLDVFSSLQATYSSDPISKPAEHTDEHGVDQEGLPPQQ
jgi:hypothetical protein